MYIEFDLPQGAGGQTAAYVNQQINRNLHEWSDLYNIPYNKKIHKYTLRVTFDDETKYAFFAMSWNPKVDTFRSYLLNYRLIDPSNRV